MVIRDKQELKRCVKQAVRKAQVSEVDLAFDVEKGSMGVTTLLETWAPPAGAPNDVLRRMTANSTPFSEGARTMFSALSALEMPVYNLNNAQTIYESHDRSAYLREVLDVMQAKRVLVRVKLSEVENAFFEDDRFAVLADVSDEDFIVSGRFGPDYEATTYRLADQLARAKAQDLYVGAQSMKTLFFCLIPLSEETGCVLHLRLTNEGDFAAFAGAMLEHPHAHAVVSCRESAEKDLIRLAQDVPNMLVKLSSLEHMPLALETLGTGFIPFSAGAKLPEQMLGRWINARETIWQKLFDAYLPLARAGYEIRSEAVQHDVSALLGGNLLSFYNND